MAIRGSCVFGLAIICCCCLPYFMQNSHDMIHTFYRADSRFAASHWETTLVCKDVSPWLAQALFYMFKNDDASHWKYLTDVDMPNVNSSIKYNRWFSIIARHCIDGVDVAINLLLINRESVGKAAFIFSIVLSLVTKQSSMIIALSIDILRRSTNDNIVKIFASMAPTCVRKYFFISLQHLCYSKGVLQSIVQ